MGIARRATVTTPLGEQALTLLSLSGGEALGQPFSYELELLSERADIVLAELVGQPLCVKVELAGETPREFSGVVTKFSLVGARGRYSLYAAELRPWFWLLCHTKNSRIFQERTVPDLVLELFREAGFTDFVCLLGNEYRSWDYLVQFRESDFNFISRILEQEGIYYFFQYTDGKHALVLADAPDSHTAEPGFEEIPFLPTQSTQLQRERDHIHAWRISRQVRPGKYVSKDFNFEMPAVDLQAELTDSAKHSFKNLAVFDFPGEFQSSLEAETEVRVRLEQLQAGVEWVHGVGNVSGLRAGSLFTLTDHPREDQNIQYLITQASYRMHATALESGENNHGEVEFTFSFTALDAKTQFRPETRTRKPRVEGPQTAIVVGPKDREIWTDAYGRVKVRFHWDRRPKEFTDTSCWVRVSQAWAGSGFGALHVPRIDQEVIVDFLDGDPDRPIITGRVYNAGQLPPYDLPEHATQSGILSRSTGFSPKSCANELRFEDKHGNEEFFMQAQRNHTVVVKACQSTSVGGNQSCSVTGNQSASVTGTRELTVRGKTTETHRSEREVRVEKKDSLTVLERSLVVETLDSTEVKGPQKLDVNGAVEISAASTYAIQNNNNHFKLESGQVTLDSSHCALKLTNTSATLSGLDKVTLSAGAAKVTLEASGVITLEGTEIKLSGATAVQLSAGGSSVKVDASGVAITGAEVKLNA